MRKDKKEKHGRILEEAEEQLDHKRINVSEEDLERFDVHKEE